MKELKKTIKILAVTAVILLTANYLLAQDKSLNSQKLDQYLETLADNNKVMCAVTISEKGKNIYQKSVGFASTSKNIPNSNTTKFRIGSISKMFTTAMVFQLIEENKLSLDTKLSKFFKKVPNASKITISDLLNHRSGIFNFTNDSLYTTYMTQPKSKEELLEIIYGYESEFEPGSMAKYSNSNFLLLSFIIEDVTGNSYQEELKKRITDKLKLKNTYYGGKTSIQDNEARSYSLIANTWKVEPETDMSIPIGAGAIVSTTSDLNRFIRALFNTELISEKSLEIMKDIRDGYGRGLFQIPFGERKFYGHNGGIDGFVSNLSYLPEEDLAFSITCNGVNTNFNDILIGILSIYYDKPFEIPDYNQKSIVLDEGVLKQLEGEFSSDAFPLDITIKIENGILTAQATGQNSFPLTPYEDGIFKFEKAGITITYEGKGNKIKNYNSFMMKQGSAEFNYSRKQ